MPLTSGVRSGQRASAHVVVALPTWRALLDVHGVDGAGTYDLWRVVAVDGRRVTGRALPGKEPVVNLENEEEEDEVGGARGGALGLLGTGGGTLGRGLPFGRRKGSRKEMYFQKPNLKSLVIITII